MIFLLSATALLAGEGSDDELVGISFGRTVEDQALIRFVQTYDAKPVVLYFVTDDLFGSRRFNSQKDLTSNMQALRETIIKMQRSARDGTMLRARELAGSTSVQSLSSDKNIQRNVAYVLHRYEVSLDIENDVLGGKPIIYSLNMKVPKAKLAALRHDPLISSVRISELRLTKIGLLKVVAAPEHSSALATKTFEEDSWSPQALYDRILGLANASAEEGLAK